MSDGGTRLQTRARLLAAATDLYSRKGMAETSVQDVVEHAGLTKGAFYHYFKSKAHLIEAIHDDYVGGQIADIEQILEHTTDPMVALEESIVAMFRGVVEHRSSVSLFMREFPSMPDDLFGLVRARRDEFEQLVVRIIDDGSASGQFVSELPSKAIAFGVIGMCAWAMYWFDTDGPLTAEMVGRNLAHVVIDGLAPPSARRRSAASDTRRARRDASSMRTA